ncbi:hypothetical protein [uncultured Croceitalea sp.]|uniref:hypothetical protein n=1 Tax=uncultured Croceitalea sp. TaxID=1798908 RepID=UPI003305FB7F
MYQEHQYVQKCLQQIEERLDWGSSDAWHNDMFIELSGVIQQETKILLSPVTLKRVWGRIDYKSAPSITTLNTLAQFAGYQNWRDFKAKGVVKGGFGISKKIRVNLGVIMLSASIMTLIFISFYSLKSPDNVPQPIDASKVVFESRPISKSLPNSVVFNLDLSEINADSIHIQQYWDPTKTIPLSANQRQATGQYYLPGYFRAKLIADGKIIKQHDLFIKTEGWLATLDYQPIPKYLKAEDSEEGKLGLSKTLIEELAANEKPLTSTYHLVEDFKSVSGDNFELRSTIKNSYRDKWAVCQNAAIFILGTKGAMIISFAIPGCTSELGLMMNDVYIDGKEHDLSNLGVDLSEPKEIKIHVKDKKLSIFLENRQLFTGSYREDMGRIAGVRYRFLGAGEVYSSKLSSLKEEFIIPLL